MPEQQMPLSGPEPLNRPIADGDIFRWSFKDAPDFMPYHCCSQIAVVRDGRLVDTYWHGISGNKTWSWNVAQAKLNLEFVANFADLIKSGEHKREYYDDADCVDLNHANSSGGDFYLRKGAKKSAAKMREVAECKRAEAIRKMLSAADDVRRMDRVLNQLSHSETVDDIFI